MPRKNNSSSTRRRYKPISKWADDPLFVAREGEDSHEAEIVDPAYIGPYMRSLYLTACIGRPLLSHSLRDFNNQFPDRLGRLSPRPKPGIVYVSGQELAKKTKHGLAFGTPLRLSPSRCIEVTIAQLKATRVLIDNLADEEITLPLRQIIAKSWGKIVQLQAVVADTREQDSDSFRIQGELDPVINAFGLNKDSGARAEERIPYYRVPFATVNTSAPDNIVDFLNNQEFRIPMELTFTSISEVQVPLPTM